MFNLLPAHVQTLAIVPLYVTLQSSPVLPSSTAAAGVVGQSACLVDMLYDCCGIEFPAACTRGFIEVRAQDIVPHEHSNCKDCNPVWQCEPGGSQELHSMQVLFEAEEETGSVSLPGLLQKKKGLLHADLAISCDGGQISEDQGSIPISMRGRVSFDLEGQTLHHDVHSGRMVSMNHADL